MFGFRFVNRVTCVWFEVCSRLELLWFGFRFAVDSYWCLVLILQ